MLTLPIKQKWFDMIKSGVKEEEYREITPFYEKRFRNVPTFKENGKTMFLLILQNGYRKDAQRLVIRCWMDIGKGKTEWGAAPGVQYYRLHIVDKWIDTPF